MKDSDKPSNATVLASVRRVCFSRRTIATVEAYLFLLPFLTAFGLFLVYPFIKNFWISLHDWDLLAVAFNPDAKEFVGMENYVRTLWGRRMTWDITHLWHIKSVLAIGCLILWFATLRGSARLGTAVFWTVVAVTLVVVLGFHPGERGRWYDKEFWNAVRNTFVFVALAIPPIMVISLTLAVLLNRPTRTMAVFRTLFYLPQVLSVAVITLVWWYMLTPGQGLLANVMRLFDLTPFSWTTDPVLAMWAIVIATVWWTIGFPMIVLLAGLQEIPKDRYEAARLDGAGPIALTWHITIPGLKRPLVFVFLYEVISHFQVFGQSHLLTGGGPGDATQTFVRYLYQTGFRDNELGRGAAMSVLLFLVMAIFSFLYLKFSTQRRTS